MIYLIVGHRGVGKTLWLKKIEKLFSSNKHYAFEESGFSYNQEPEQEFESMSTLNKGSNHLEFKFFDLDKEIEKTNNQKLSKYFDTKAGQKQFRALEHTTLTHLINKYKSNNQIVFIAIGAGFDWKNFTFQNQYPPRLGVIHLMRETDSHGRVFLDRPRLIPNKGPYEEYMLLYAQRDKMYRQIRTESFVLPEQDFHFNSAEKLFFTNKINITKKKLVYFLKKILNKPKKRDGFIITLNKESLPTNIDQWPAFVRKRLTWKNTIFEIRDDQLNNKELEYLLSIIPKYRQLLSFRSTKNDLFNQLVYKTINTKPQWAWDWPVERGYPSFCSMAKITDKRFPFVLSLHERKQGESVSEGGKRLTQYKAGHFKLALPINSFAELMEGHLWFLQDPKNRSFLPISPLKNKISIKGKGFGSCGGEATNNEGKFFIKQLGEGGRWRWYRQLFGSYMKMNFVREGDSLVLDQPFLYEHLVALDLEQSEGVLRQWPVFCAVLGDPVGFSASPAFHREFFKSRGMMFVKIKMSEKEMTKNNLLILQKMGLRFVAVTAPLKKKAFEICDRVDSSVGEFKSVNTLIWKKGKWLGANTDHYGFKMFMSYFQNEIGTDLEQSHNQKTEFNLCPPRHGVVWGGGGMRAILQKELPNAIFYSARTGPQSGLQFVDLFSDRNPSVEKGGNLRPRRLGVVIWAVGRSRMSKCRFPPSVWRPKWVVDLNYTADSPGREYALLCGANYISGEIMFKYQALKQQSLFLKHK